MSKKLLIGSNLKMYKNIAETQEYLKALISLTSDLKETVTLFIILSFTSLDAAATTAGCSHVLLGAQNMCPYETGQYTGEISPLMLSELHLDIVEIGHSERRHVFHETDCYINEKVKSALKHKFIALLCIGETAQQKDFGISQEILSQQLKIGLSGVSPEHAKNIWIAYEPVWSIGTDGIPADPEYIQEQLKSCHKILASLYPDQQVPILYGGSVNPENASAFISLPEVSGLFVGRSAWTAEGFNKLIRDILPIYMVRQQEEIL